jgi:D-alanyl-D-alanine-carboxypeptidase/D-alanyl-D-alanine-endopeptidase
VHRRARARAAVTAIAAVLVGVAAGGCSAGNDAGRAAAAPGSPTRAAAAAGPTPSKVALTRSFDAVYHRHQHEILGMCVGAIDERTSAVKCYGKVARASKQRPTEKTLFQIGSISKTLTATLLALRVHAGAVRLEDPLRRYIPAADGSARIPPKLTLLDVATHYSGLPRMTPVENSLDISSLDQYFAAAGHCESTPGCPLGPPGGHYAYSNYAYGVLGQALAVHDGYSESSYSAWEKDNAARVTGPLGMTQTRSGLRWRATEPAVFDKLRARATVGDPPHEAQPPFFPPPPYADAAGGLYSSSLDMLSWLSFSMGLSGTPALDAARPLLYDTPRLIRAREDPADATRRVGLAWRIDTKGSGSSSTTCVSKPGESRGFTSHMVFVRHRPLGAFVLLNTVPENPTAPAIGTDAINSLPSATGAPRATSCPVSG